MKLTWYGHACFMLDTAEGSVVFDPYEDNYMPNLRLPKLSADNVICSHGHGDHSAAHAVTLTGNEPTFKITQISCFHDEAQGEKRGKNTITVVEAEGKRIAHFGDLGHKLDGEQLAAIGHIDVLMIPVGGIYTVDAKTAKEICDVIKPAVIVPMHYRMGSAGLQNVAGVDEFLTLFDEDEILRLGKNTWEIGDISQSIAVLELC